MKKFSEGQYAGAFVRLPMGLADRIAVAAENHMARQCRYVDPEADPITVVEQWLQQLEQARTQPTPSAEPGDLLVKLARSEFWSFTARGHWIELAPVYRMGDKRAEQQTEREFFIDPIAAKEAGFSGGMRDRPVPGVVTGPSPRFFGKSVVEEHLERKRDFDRLWPTIKKCADELLELENAIDVTVAAAELPDLGIDDRLRAFRDGIDTARRRLLVTAAREIGGYPDEADDD